MRENPSLREENGGGEGKGRVEGVWEGQEDSIESRDAHSIYNKFNTVVIFLNDLANTNRQILEIIFNFRTCVSCKIDIANQYVIIVNFHECHVHVCYNICDRPLYDPLSIWPHILTFISVTVIF